MAPNSSAQNETMLSPFSDLSVHIPIHPAHSGGSAKKTHRNLEKISENLGAQKSQKWRWSSLILDRRKYLYQIAYYSIAYYRIV